MSRIQVKICCISSLAEAQLAIRMGATAIGLVGAMPSGPGVISDALIAEIAAQTPPTIQSFLLTSETDSEAIIRHHQRTHTTTIQMVDRLQKGTYAELKAALPEVQLVQVIHVLDEQSLVQARAIAPQVDALLLDSGNPNLKVKTLGGTGKTHNWQISKAIVQAVDCPVYLAGGLAAHNVAAAIASVNPTGVDLCTGVRTRGRLDEQKLATFFQALPH